MSYADYIGAKLASVPPSGIDAAHGLTGLFPHQDDLVAWALRRGRCAIFADTGAEPASVYRHLEWLTSGVLPFPVRIVTNVLNDASNVVLRTLLIRCNFPGEPDP